MSDELVPQTPAEGIASIKADGWGGTAGAIYEIFCDCTDPDHTVRMQIEKDEFCTCLEFWVKVNTPYFQKYWNRFGVMWKLFWYGYVELEMSVILKDQQIVNMADVLLKAVKDEKKK